ncbi:MAG: creatininase family protein [Gordonia sp. (in: high G+C Gram-positive bacteria)]
MIELISTPWTEVAEYADDTLRQGRPVLGVLGFGALEQHGPHLPLGTDTYQADHLARLLAIELDALLLPSIGYGATWTNAGYPGTVSLSPATVRSIVTDIGASLRDGQLHVCGLVVVNGDWGNRMPLMNAAQELIHAGLATIILDYPGMDERAAEILDSPAAAPNLHHADELETSLMLAIDEQLVRPDPHVSCYPKLPADFGIRPRQLHPYSATGVFGDPSAASIVKGRDLISTVVARSVEILDDFITDCCDIHAHSGKVR